MRGVPLWYVSSKICKFRGTVFWKMVRQKTVRIEQTGRVSKGGSPSYCIPAVAEYSMLLINDQVMRRQGRFSPEIERARKMIKQTGTVPTS